MNAHVKKLAGKYYGTYVVIPEWDSQVKIWIHRGPPSARQLANWGIRGDLATVTTAENEVLNEMMCDSHYETVTDYTVATLLMEAINTHFEGSAA